MNSLVPVPSSGYFLSMKKAVAIIAARGGSKRIPRKNIKPFFGKPMICYSIDAALASGLFDKVVVSTDSEEIAAVAISAGAEVPSLRPAELSDDKTPTIPVLLHAIKELVPNYSDYVHACSIMATAPFVQQSSLREGYELMQGQGVSSALSVTTFPFPILRAMKLNEESQIRWAWPEYEQTRSQDLPEFYHDAGQFVWFDIASFLRNGKILMPDSLPVKIPRKFVQDIDTLEDWSVAELIYRTMKAE